MAWKSDTRRYGGLRIALHWVSAAAILALLPLGFIAAHTPRLEVRADLLRAHVPLGVLAFALTLVRVGWLLFDKRPRDPIGQPRWQTYSAHAVHRLLDLAVIVMGVSGIGLMILSGAAAVLFFGAPGPLPHFPDFKPLLVHGMAAFALIGLLGLHSGAAIYHQFGRRDRLLARMGVGSII